MTGRKWRIHPTVPAGTLGLYIFDGPGPPLNLVDRGEQTPYGTAASGSLTFPSWSAGARGGAMTYTATTDGISIGENTQHRIATDVTIILGYEKTDGTNRNSQAFGYNGAISRMLVHLPWSDGNAYWDFGAGRLTLAAAGVTGYNVWAFTAGPRGMEIYKNLTRTNAASFPTRTITDAVSFGLGSHGIGTDLARTYFFFLHSRQLPIPYINAAIADPYRVLFMPNTAGNQTGLPVAASGATAFPWLYYAAQRTA